MPTTLHTLTGRVANVPDELLDNPKLKSYLKVVPEGTKPLLKGMFKPGTVEEFDKANKVVSHKVEDGKPVEPKSKEGENK